MLCTSLFYTLLKWKKMILLLFSVLSNIYQIHSVKDSVSCYNVSDNGASYSGNQNKTTTREMCLRWDNVRSNYSHYTGPNNFCRNPLPNQVRRPWCYIGQNFEYRECDIPACLECLNEKDNGASYAGTINTTKTGTQCQNWKASRYFKNEDHNFCRNPDFSKQPWCYINNNEHDYYEYCDVPSCGTLCPVFTDANLIYHKQYQAGDTVVLKCKSGYRLIGSQTLSCQSSGLWNFPAPTCEEITCQQPILRSIAFHLQPNGHLSKFKFNDTYNVICSNGYIGEPVTRRCIESGWSDNKPSCSRIKCRPLPGTSIMNANYTPMLQTYDYGQQLTISCNDGFSGTSVTSFCVGQNVWNVTTIQCDRIKCGPLSRTSIMNANYTPILKTYDYGHQLTVSCNDGFSGTSVTSFCVGQNVWNVTNIQCDRVPCPSLSVSDLFLNVSQLSRRFYFGDRVVFACQKGYNISGSSIITCVANDKNSIGRWSAKQPSCLELVFPTSQSSKSDTGVIGGGLSAAIIVVIIIVLVIFLKRRQEPVRNDKSAQYKQSSRKKEETNIYSEVRESGIVFVKDNTDENQVVVNFPDKDKTYSNEQSGDGGYYDFSEGPQMSKTAVPIKDFCKYAENGRGKGGKIETEFLKFKTGLQYPTTAALRPGNKIKNKYKNLYAYDETRVILETSSQCKSDYINSSYINGYGRLQQYIASQGPQDNTVNEFWRMVIQIDSGKIVMLTNVFEEAKQKCNHYWPEAVGKSNNFVGVIVTLMNEDIYSDFTIRHLKLQKENLNKKVIQFHFTAWPDKDVPKYSSSLVHFRQKVNSTDVSAKGPTVVHCSAGIGRTGTYIALDYAVTEAKEVDYVDIFRCVETLRRQRVNMVQTAHQYVFLHDAVLEALMCANSGILAKDFPDVFKDLMKFDSEKKQHKLKVEYDLLNAMSGKHDEEVFEHGKSAENKSKNRYSNIIPVVSEMPRLTSTVEGHNEYINAVFLPGYKSSRAFVITQMPMKKTVIDFWRLIYDYRISVVVMLNMDYEQNDKYWPEENNGLLFSGPFKIEHKKLARRQHYSRMELSFTSNHDQRKVTLFQQTSWNEEKTIPDDIEGFFSFIYDVEEARGNENRESPLLVHCLNGCDKSGLYCVITTVIERLRIEQDVDIQHIIKQMRNRRPQIIPNYEQFRFLYEAVIEYLKQFETYANFD